MLARLATFLLIIGLLAADAYFTYLFVFVLRMTYPASHSPYTNAVVIALIVAWAGALIAAFWGNAHRGFRLFLVTSPGLIVLGLYGYAIWLGVA